LILALVFAALSYVAIRIVALFLSGAVSLERLAPPVPVLLLAATLYLMAHLFRIMRLALLIGGWRAGLRSISAFHMMTAAASSVAPAKLGEVYRVAQLALLIGNATRAVLIVWWERSFDVCALLIILGLAFLNSSPAQQATLYPVAALAAAFVVVTTIIFFVLPDNLRRLSVLIIRRYNQAFSIRILQAIKTVRDAIQDAPRIIRQKISSLVTLTILIWLCEIACCALVFSQAQNSLGSAMHDLLAFFSQLTQGETLLSALSHPLDALQNGTLRYILLTQGILIFTGLLATLAYAAIWRGRRAA
jgi:hypothetical protein